MSSTKNPHISFNDVTTSNLNQMIEDIPRFSAKLETAIHEILPNESKNPLYAAEFDPIAYINGIFPDEASLDNLDSFISSVNKDMCDLDSQIRQDVRLHSVSRESSQAALDSAVASIATLFHQVRDIKARAEPSEVMVHEICRDITGLDHAKRHLETSIQSLRHMHMLVSATAQLREWVDASNFKEAASLLEEVTSLLLVFEAHRGVEKIRVLEGQINTMKNELQGLVLGELHTHVLNKNKEDFTEERAKLNAACLVMDHLSPSVRTRFLSSFIDMILSDYRLLFDTQREGSSLDQIPRRYAWFKQQVKKMTQVYNGIFPPHWKVLWVLAEQFCTITHDHIVALLEDSPHANLTLSPPLSLIDIKEIVNVPDRQSQRSSLRTAFSLSSWAQRIQLPSKPDSKTDSKPADDDVMLTLDDFTESSSSSLPSEEDVAILLTAIIKTLEFERELDPKSRLLNSLDPLPQSPPLLSPTSTDPDLQKDDKLPKLDRGMISSAFTQFTNGILIRERQSLSDLLVRVADNEEWTPVTLIKGGGRLGSSDELFLNLKVALTNLSKLERPHIMESLWREFTHTLQAYARLLASQIKWTPDTVLNGPDLQRVCLLVNTAEYVLDTLPALVTSFKKKLKQLEQLNEKLNTSLPYTSSSPSEDEEENSLEGVSEVEEVFEALVHECANAIIGSVVHHAGHRLREISATNWDALVDVGDTSACVTHLIAALAHDVPRIEVILSPRYHSYVMTQVAAQLNKRFSDAVYLCRDLSPSGIQQLALDTHTLKDILPSLPLYTFNDEDKVVSRPSPNTAAYRVFARSVRRDTGRLEAVFKVLGSSDDHFVQHYIQLVPDGDETGLRKIAELRGLRRQDVAGVIATYKKAKANEAKQLEAESKEN